MAKTIYGICGKRRHGKDTLAKAITAIDPSFTILHFADDLKRILKDVFDLTEQQVQDPIIKELDFGFDIVMDDYLALINAYTGLNVQPKGIIARTPRKILQSLGTDYIRSVCDNYWIDRVVSKINAAHNKFLVPDVRFPNEEKALRALGGKIIKVERTDLTSNDDASKHASETEIDRIQADFILKIGEGDFSAINAYAQSLTG
jgi:hypothetical protein